MVSSTLCVVVLQLTVWYAVGVTAPTSPPVMDNTTECNRIQTCINNLEQRLEELQCGSGKVSSFVGTPLSDISRTAHFCQKLVSRLFYVRY